MGNLRLRGEETCVKARTLVVRTKWNGHGTVGMGTVRWGSMGGRLIRGGPSAAASPAGRSATNKFRTAVEPGSDTGRRPGEREQTGLPASIS